MRKKISPPQIIVSGFLLMIIIGSFLLSLPVSSANHESTSFLDSLFTATSAVCVTGLIVQDTATYWSSFGKLVIISLIQIGGLGFMTITSFAAILAGKKMGLRDRILLQESLGQTKIQGIIRLTKNILLTTILVELVGALLLTSQFVKDFAPGQALAKGVFHSISAFCNAGFDLMGDFSSMTNYYNNPIVNLSLILLIIIGGLGFTVILDLKQKKKLKRLELHSKLSLSVTGFLLLLGAFVFFFLEYKNPQTLGPMSLWGKIQASSFQSVSPRTAGFNSIDLGQMTDSSKFFMILLMFIGGSPASTAGGIKTTTFAVLILTMLAFVRNKDVEAYGRRIPYSIVNKAMTIVIIASFIVVTGSMLISIAHPELAFLDILFEVVSAYATVGLTLGITTQLSGLAKLILIFIMFAGRVGALTIIMALASRDKKYDYQLPEGNVLL